ncbi:MAG: hypothetical protein CMK59_07690 [Proteobacteria bacterium]|nr:hypothetical protein [Pseudomonadota bacterium]
MFIFILQMAFAEPTAARITADGTVYYEQSDPKESSEAKSTEKEKTNSEKAGVQTISLELQDADIHSVIRLFADATGRNFVLDDTVQGKVTVFLKDVPWDQALQAILMSKGLVMVPIGNPPQSSSPILIRPI